MAEQSWPVRPPVLGSADRKPRRVERMDRQPVVAGLGRLLDDSWLLIPLAVFVALAVVAPLMIGTDPAAQNLTARLQPPVFNGGSWDHPLGTDSLGRDVLARIAEGARLSFGIGLIAAAGSAVIGVLLGLIAGVAGGPVDRTISALADIQLALPFIVIGIVLTATFGQSLSTLLAVLIITGWLGYIRIVRLQARSLRRAAFVEAAVAIGARRRHILVRHVLPNLTPTILVLVCQQIAAMMLYEASLTFLGIGLPIEQVTLGGLVRDGQALIFNGWWVSVWSGLAIALAVFGFNLLADWLQRRFDPLQVRRP